MTASTRVALISGLTLMLSACLRLADFQPPCEDTHDLNSDSKNCGACGHACEQDQICEGGKCRCAIKGWTACNASGQAYDSCKDLSSDPSNCGVCWNSCGGGTCEQGQCVCNGTTCGVYCVDLSTDLNNCGSCDNQCPAGQVCLSGACTFVCLGTAIACGDRLVENCATSMDCEVVSGCHGNKNVSCLGLSSYCELCDGVAGCACSDACDNFGGCTCSGVTTCEQVPWNYCNPPCSEGDYCRGEAVACSSLSHAACAEVPGCEPAF